MSYSVYTHGTLGIVTGTIETSPATSTDTLVDWIYFDKLVVNVPQNLYYNIDSNADLELLGSSATGKGSIIASGLLSSSKTYSDFLDLLDITNEVTINDKVYHGAWVSIGITQYKEFKCVFTGTMKFNVKYVSDDDDDDD